MTEDDMYAETRRLNAETQLLLARQMHRRIKRPPRIAVGYFLAGMVIGGSVATIAVLSVLTP